MIGPEKLTLLVDYFDSPEMPASLRAAAVELVEWYRATGEMDLNKSPHGKLARLEREVAAHAVEVAAIADKAKALVDLEGQAVALVWAFDGAEDIGHPFHCPAFHCTGDDQLIDAVCTCGWAKLAGAVDDLAETLGINDPSPDALGEGCLGVIDVGTDPGGVGAAIARQRDAPVGVDRNGNFRCIAEPILAGDEPRVIDVATGGPAAPAGDTPTLHCEHGRQFNWACKPCGRGTP